MRRHLITKILLSVLLIAFVSLAVQQVRSENQIKLRNNIELKSREAQLLELDNKYKDVLQHKTKTKQEKDEQAKKIRQLEKEKARLERELSAKKESQSELNRVASNVNKTLSGVNTAYASENSIQDTIRNAASKYGVSGDYLLRIANCESTFNPRAYNPSGATGLFQYKPATWASFSDRAGYSGASIYNVTAQANVTAWAFSNGLAYHWECK